jgi:hypothetical protein
MAGFKTIFRTATTDTATTDVEGLGRIRWEDDKAYRWVCNPTTNFTPAAGNLVCHAFTDGATATQKIYQPATATLGFLAGVVCGTFAASTGTNPVTYGWIQILGQSAAVAITPVNTQTTAAPVAGNALIAVNSQVYAATGQATGTAAVYTRNITCLDAVAAGTAAAAGNVYINCL